MILTCAKLATGKAGDSLIDNGAVVINKGSILAVGIADQIIKRYSKHRVYRLRNAVLLPGLINVHTHLELPPLLDTIRAATFPGWVTNLIGTKKKLTTEDYALATRQNINSLVRCGTTCVGEICSHNVSSGALKQSGLRTVVYNELIHMDPLRQPGRLASLLSCSSSLMRTGISPHTPFTVSKQALQSIHQLSQNMNIRLAMHIAESQDEIKLLQGKKSGLRELYRLAGWDLAWAPSAESSFEYLQRTGFLSPNLLAVHAVQVTDSDIAIIKKSGVSIAHCPRSNNETGVGRMPLKKLLRQGISVGLGTDSLASVTSLNLWDEMRYAYKIHQRDNITAKDIFELATIGGAAALGMDDEIGSLEFGKRADIIAVPLPRKNTGGLYSDLLRETKSCIMTMVNGKLLHFEGTQE